MPWEWIEDIIATAGDYALFLMGGVLQQLVVGAATFGLLMIRAVGTITPECGISLALSDSLIGFLTQWIRFWWPILSWLPWENAWFILQLWIVWTLIKFNIKYLPRIVHWIFTIISGMIQWFHP